MRPQLGNGYRVEITYVIYIRFQGLFTRPLESVANHKGKNSYRTVVFLADVRKLSDWNFICGRFSQHDEQEERDGGRGEKCDCVDAPTRHECPKHCRNLLEKQFLHISAFETLPSKGNNGK